MNYAWLNQSLPLISHTRCSICPPSRKYYRLGSHPLDVSLITISKSLSISTPQIIRLALHCLSLTTCFLDTFSTNTLCSEAWPRLLRITASAQTPLKRWKSKVKSQKKKKKASTHWQRRDRKSHGKAVPFVSSLWPTHSQESSSTPDALILTQEHTKTSSWLKSYLSSHKPPE